LLLPSTISISSGTAIISVKTRQRLSKLWIAHQIKPQTAPVLWGLTGGELVPICGFFVCAPGPNLPPMQLINSSAIMAIKLKELSGLGEFPNSPKRFSKQNALPLRL